MGLVLLELNVPARRTFRVERYSKAVRSFFFDDLHQHVRKTEDSVRRKAG